MASPVDSRLRERLVAGRAALDELTRSRPEPRLLDLLQRLDETLGELGTGTLGVCAVCHDPIGRETLDEHPLISVCLECMSPEQRDELERDITTAGEVQRAFLPPKSLRHDGWEVAYHWEPFGVVSGDHVDIVRPAKPSDPLHLLLGDVAGKGLGASLLQSQLHALFRALATRGTSLSELLGRANQVFFEATSPSDYATLIAARLHSDGKILLANAGHPRPLLADHEGVRTIEEASVPLGMVDNAEYGEREIHLHPGDTLLLYTDGLTETWHDGEEYGVGRAVAALGEAMRLSPTELLAACRRDLQSFVGDARRGDDLTMVAVRRVQPA